MYKQTLQDYHKLLLSNIQNVLLCHMNHFSFDVAMCYRSTCTTPSVSLTCVMPVHLVLKIIMQSFLIYNADIQLNCVFQSSL